VGLKPYYLGDTSAVARISQPQIAVRLGPLLESGLVARCTPTDLEAGFSSTSPVSHRAMREFRSTWPFIAMDQSVLDRAVEMQDALADRSQQRGALREFVHFPDSQWNSAVRSHDDRHRDARIA
jgi:hypothetical protein